MQIEYIIDTIGFARKNFLKLIENCSIEQLNEIPEGFSNNLVWNIAHALSSQQMLCYELSSLEPRVDKTLVDAYRPTTFPEKFVDGQRFTFIKDSFLKSVDQLKDDYRSGIFKTYKERQTRFGVLITNIEEAIFYVSTHETLHFGYAKALYRAL
jgi:hypothetical protein